MVSVVGRRIDTNMRLHHGIKLHRTEAIPDFHSSLFTNNDVERSADAYCCGIMRHGHGYFRELDL